MNIALATDYIIERDEAIELLEVLCEQHPDAPIYTLAHVKEKVLGPIQHRKIFSTGLSKKIQRVDDFYRLAYLVPGFIKNLKTKREIDILISISRGFIHALATDNSTRHLSYITSLQRTKKAEGLTQRLFRSYLDQWKKRSLSRPDKLVFSSRTLAENCRRSDAEVSYPPVNFREFQMDLAAETQTGGAYYVVVIDESSAHDFKKLVEIFKRLNTQAFILLKANLGQGDDEELITVLKDKCLGEEAKTIKACRAVIDLSGSFYPKYALGGLLAGKPFIAYNSPINREFLAASGGTFIETISELEQAIRAKDKQYRYFRPRELFRLGLKHSDLKWRQVAKSWSL